MDGNAAEHLHDFLRTLPTESVSQTHDVTSDSHQQLSDKPGMVHESTTVFSDVTVRVAEVLASRSGSRVTGGSEITVTRPGGKVRLDGVDYSATHLSFPPLKVGTQYILFLTYIQQSDSFKTKDPDAAFAITDEGNIAATNPGGLPFDEAVNSNTLSQITRNVAAVCRQGR